MTNLNAGIGEKATGAEKKRIKLAIEHDLDNEITEKEFNVDDAKKQEQLQFLKAVMND